jgi:acid phosphatase
MSRLRPRRAAAAGALAAAVLAGSAACGGGSPTANGSRASAASTPTGTEAPAGTAAPTATSSPAAARAGGLPTPAHVVVVVFENKNVADVIGSADAPYLNELAGHGASLTEAFGVTHPSQPNYLALFSGSTQGVTDDSCPQSFSTPNLAEQLRAAKRSFTGYSEGLPSAGYTGCRAGQYARKHNPWADFPALPASVNQPLTALPKDFSALPTVAFIIPDLCGDMHNCTVAQGDAWARAHLSAYVAWARTHDSLLIVTFDEDDGSADNHIPALLVGPMVRPGRTVQRVDHYGLLRTIEDMYGLPPLGEAASARPLTGIWTG